MVWGMMEGIRRSLKQLDGGSVSVSGVYQLRLDFCFLETILSRYIILLSPSVLILIQYLFRCRYLEEDSGITHSIHAQLSQMEEDAYQNGAGEDPIEVDLDAIIEDCARRSVVLFSALTGSAEVVSSPKMSTSRHIPKRAIEIRSGRKTELSASLVIGNTRLADMMRRGTRAVDRPQDRAQDRAKDARIRAETAPAAVVESPKKEENGIKGTTNKEREREKIEALRREREQRDQKGQKEQKEPKEEKRERKEGASVLMSSTGSNSSGGEKEMTSREKALAKIKEKERAKLRAK
jgi:hypothetical protein